MLKTGESVADGEDVESFRPAAGPPPGLAELLAANLRGELCELGPGTIIDHKWELRELLGEGSFGKVYEARHIKLGHPAAIKVLTGQNAGPRAKQRFLAEAQLMAGMSSQHLVRASDYGELPDGSPYFVMGLVEGKSLRYWLKERMPMSRALEIGEQLLTGLVEVHRLGVVHGDIKPENVVIDENHGKVRVLDFGLARTSADEHEGLAGTPQYMAPEMLLDRAPASVRTDVYAAGVVIYEMLTGRLPRGHMGMDIAKMREEWKIRRRVDPVLMHCKPVPEAQREALERLDELVMEAIAPKPAARPRAASILEKLERLRNELAPQVQASTRAAEPSRSEPETRHTRAKWRPSTLPAVGVLAAVAVATWYWSERLDWSPETRGGVEPSVAGEASARPLTPPPHMVYVAGGSFRRGTVDIADHFDDCRNAYGNACARCTFERELQTAGMVDVPGFFLDEYEVTNAQLAAFMVELRKSGEARIVPELGLKTIGVRPDRALASFVFSSDERFEQRPYRAFVGDIDTLEPAVGMADRPAVLVTWDLASRYCRAQGRRLPTETEWEYAARGPEGREYVWGDEPISCRVAAFGRLALVKNNAYVECRNEEKRPNAVGTSTLDRSWCGAADMGANVSEWVADAFVDPSIGCPPPGEPNDDAAEALLCHVYKGGNWVDPWRFSRPAYRPVAPPSSRNVGIGFRCAASVEETR